MSDQSELGKVVLETESGAKVIDRKPTGYRGSYRYLVVIPSGRVKTMPVRSLDAALRILGLRPVSPIGLYRCDACNRSDFESSRALAAHRRFCTTLFRKGGQRDHE